MFVPATESKVATGRLQEELAEACGVLNAATARVVSLIGRALATDAWAQLGIHSPSHWAAWQCGLSPGRARRLVAMAPRLEELPVTAAAFGAGELSVDQVAVICRHAPTHTDAEMAELAKVATVSQLSRTLRRYAFLDDEGEPVDGEPSPTPEERRRVDFGPTERGDWQLRALLPPDEGALVERALRSSRERVFAEADGEEEVTWSDALVGMAESSLASAAEKRPHRHRHRVLFHMRGEDPDHRLQLHLGSVVPDWLGRFLACDVDVTPVLEAWGLSAQPVSVGRAQRTVPDRTRALVEHRDGGCRVPGCDRTRWLHVHHIVHWQDGGPTDTANLCCLCPAHHRLHHRGLLGLTGDADQPDGLRFSDQGGRPIPSCGRPRPPDRPPPPVPPYAHPPGERLDSRWVWFTPPPSAPSPN